MTDRLTLSNARPRRTWLRFAMLAAVAFGLSLLSLRSLSAPFVACGVLWTAACFIAASLLPRPWSPRLFFGLFNAGIVLALLTGVEAYLLATQPPTTIYPEGYFTIDGVLGTVPRKGSQTEVKSVYRGRTLYDVTYTIDPNGLRLSPPSSPDPGSGCVLFFGDSFTFGEGLQDTETLPYQVGVQSAGHYKTFNFGFHGYGPHQMLAELEQGLVQRQVDCQPDTAIYSALADHVPRIAGKVPYGQHGPRYRLAASGEVLGAGHFDDELAAPGRARARLLRELKKSAVYRWITERRPKPTSEDVTLLFAIVGRSRDLLAAAYPGIQFHIILWNVLPEEQAIYQQLAPGFARMKIPVHKVEEILPGYSVGPRSLQYVLSADDLHPNALANRILADYVLKTMAGRRSSRPGPRSSP